MTMTTGAFAKALWPGVNSWYGKEYGEHKVQYTELFDTFTSRKAWEEDVAISSFGLMQVKGEGAAVQFDNEQQGPTSRYTHVTYALGFIITRELVEDDLYDVVGERKARGLAFSNRQTKEINGANVYNRAFNTNYVGGDGVTLLNSAHTRVAGGTFSNILSTAADLSEAALEQATIDLMKYTNDRGLNIPVLPVSLIVAVDNVHVADKIMQTEYEVDSTNNTVNVVRSKFPGGVKVNQYLTDADAWFIRTNVKDGMKHFVRRADDFDMDDDWDTDNAKYKATARYSFGWTDPRALYGTAGA